MKKTDANIKEETGSIPACCLTCGNDQPQFYRVIHKQCAAFGTVAGVKWEQCGAWCKRIDPAGTEGA